MRLLLLASALLIGCTVDPEPLPPEPWDRDADGVDETTDCDDRDPEAFPGATELCDGVDQDCDGLIDGEDDGDGDGLRACAECDDARVDVFPGAPSTCDGTDSDCDGTVSESEAASVGEHAACPALDCAAVDGVDQAWIHADSDTSFLVDCDGPWIHLALDSSDGLLAASKDVGNGWDKCADDGAMHWPWVGGEAAVDEDHVFGGNATVIEEASYVGGVSGEPLGAAGIAALALHASELHPDERLVAVSADNDDANWQGGSGGGLEVYSVGGDGVWTLLTPGAGGDCGGGGDPEPRPDSESAFYRWGSDSSDASGDTGLEEPLEALPAAATLPLRFVLAVHTGGGVAVGWSAPTFRVR